MPMWMLLWVVGCCVWALWLMEVSDRKCQRELVAFHRQEWQQNLAVLHELQQQRRELQQELLLKPWRQGALQKCNLDIDTVIHLLAESRFQVAYLARSR